MRSGESLVENLRNGWEPSDQNILCGDSVPCKPVKSWFIRQLILCAWKLGPERYPKAFMNDSRFLIVLGLTTCRACIVPLEESLFLVYTRTLQTYVKAPHSLTSPETQDLCLPQIVSTALSLGFIADIMISLSHPSGPECPDNLTHFLHPSQPSIPLGHRAQSLLNYLAISVDRAASGGASLLYHCSGAWRSCLLHLLGNCPAWSDRR